MKWMVILGSAAAVGGGLYRWLVAPSEPDKWGPLDVVVVILGLIGALFFVLGSVLFGVKQLLA